MKKTANDNNLSGSERSERKEQPTPESKCKALFVSWDFLAALCTAAGIASIFAIPGHVSDQVPSLMFGLSGVAAAIATLVLTAMAVLVSAIGQKYYQLLKQTPTGIRGVAKPFITVATLAAIAVAVALIAVGALAFVGNNFWCLWIVYFTPLLFFLWSVFGTVQVLWQLVDHWENALETEDLNVREKRALDKVREARHLQSKKNQR